MSDPVNRAVQSSQICTFVEVMSRRANSETPPPKPTALHQHLFEWLRWLKGIGRADGTISAYAADVWEFADWLAARPEDTPPMDGLRPSVLQQYQTHLGERDLRPATTCRKLDALSTFFRYLVRAEIMPRNPLESIPRCRPKNQRYVWMPEDEAQRVLTTIDSLVERTVFLTLYRTGLRRGELIRLQFSDVDLSSRMITVAAQKSDLRHVPISTELDSFLREYLEHRPTCSHDTFFVTSSHAVPLYETLLQRWFRRWLTSAGLTGKGYTVHSLRHSAATNWIRSGLHVAEVQHLMGHTSIETTARYLHHAQDEIREKISRISFPLDPADAQPLAPSASQKAETDAERRIADRIADAAEIGDVSMVEALTRALEAMRGEPIHV